MSQRKEGRKQKGGRLFVEYLKSGKKIGNLSGSLAARNVRACVRVRVRESCVVCENVDHKVKFSNPSLNYPK